MKKYVLGITGSVPSILTGAASTIALAEMGTVGIGAVPSIIGATAVGYAVTALCEGGFDKLEEKIWGEAK